MPTAAEYEANRANPEDQTPSEPTGASEVSQPSAPISTPQVASGASSAPVVIAGVWAGIATIITIGLLVSAQDMAYGGDAYTGIQNAVMLAVRGIAFLVFASGVLGLIFALKRR